MSYISLNTSLSSKVEGNTLKVKILAVNKGDESAFNVQAQVIAGGKSVLAAKNPELKVGQSYPAEITIPLPFAKPGTYPLTLALRYTDANQYPFSALTCQTFVYKKEAAWEVFGQLAPAAFAREGNLRLKLKNLGEKEVKVKSRLTAPRELSVNEKALEFSLPPKTEAGGSFAVKNFSALSGSTYQVFAVTEAEDENLHYAIISPGTVKLAAAQEIFGLNYPVLIFVLFSLIMVFIVSQIFKNKE